MTFDPDRFDEALERLLQEDPSQREDQTLDPLLRLSLQLRHRLEPVAPDPRFRARLKADLLQKAADNVRPFPIAARLSSESTVSRWRRARRAVAALAIASAASIGLAVGYSSLHQQISGRQQNVAFIAPTLETHTAVPSRPTATTEQPTATLEPTHTTRVTTVHVTTGRHGNPGNSDTLPPYATHASHHLPSATPLVVTPSTRITALNSEPTRVPTGTPVPVPSPTATAHGVTPATATASHSQPTIARHRAPTATPVPTHSPPSATATPAPPTATPVAVLPTASATRPAVVKHADATAIPTARPSDTRTPAPTATKARPRPTITPARHAPTEAATTIPPPPTATAVPPTATAVPPTAVPPSATVPRPSPTAVPTHTSHVATATATGTPRRHISQVATATIAATATTAPARATSTPAPPTATTQPEPSSTVAAPTATVVSTEVVAPTSTATEAPATATSTFAPAPSDTPLPVIVTPIATATNGPIIVAQVTVSATAGGGISNPAAHVAGSPTIVVPSTNQFPAPSNLDAAPDSPLAHTTPFTPGVLLKLPAAFPPDPVSLAVYKPVSGQPSPVDQLRLFGLRPSKVLSDAKTRVVAIVSADGRFYRADYQARSTGFRLRLSLLTAVPASEPQPPSFDAASSARTFLGAHQLVGDGLQLDSVTTAADGTKTAHFSEYAPDQIAGAHALISFNSRGVLFAADIQWVLTSVAPLEPAISSSSALDGVLAGNGFVSTTGALPDGTATITGTTILYLPVLGADGTYYEPVYRFSGSNITGSAFQVYMPALDRAYLR
jgi:hypothetical protein